MIKIVRKEPTGVDFPAPEGSRRAFVALGTALLFAGAVPRGVFAAAADPQLVSIENFSAAGRSTGVVKVPKVVKTDAEWRAQLSQAAYGVTRHAGTEYAFSGEYDHNKADGLYRCICCGTALYDSKAKYDSGTGWPSFWRAISRFNVVKTADHSAFMDRDAISCGLCDAHLGHVFPDGPPPTGLRYCMNSVALNFIPRAR